LIRSKLALLAAALLPLFARAAAPAPRPASDLPDLAFERYTLPNGLTVILHVDRKLPVVHVNQWFHVGSKNEEKGRTGFAHLFEHMMFQGSANAKEDYFVYAERLGANLREGGVNGTTSNDRTNYFATVPSANLEALLWLESDRLATLPEATTQEKLDNQRAVVKNERRQSYEAPPYGRTELILLPALFPADHPYHWPGIGSHEDLTAASLEDVKAFFRRWYTPNNLTLVVAGDFDPAEARRLVEKYFGSIPPGPALDRPARWIPRLDGEKVFEVADRVPQARTTFAWPSPEFFADDNQDLLLAGRILVDGLSSRLQKVLVYEKQLCTSVEGGQDPQEIAGLFTLQATARPGASLPEIERIIDEEVARLARTGPTAAELARARNKAETDFVAGLERIGGFGGKADVLNQYQTFAGDAAAYRTDLARLRAATPASVKAAVTRWIANRNRVVLRFFPETSGRPAAVALDRSKQPAPGAERRFVTPEVKTARLSNGLDLLVVERHDLPKVNARLVVRAGAAADPAGKEGLAALTFATLDKGTRTRKALEIEDALGDLGTSLAVQPGRESASLTLEVLRRNLPGALDVLADVARNPTFPAAEVERERARTLDTRAQLARNPGAVAARVSSMLTFGAGHPYGRPVQGLPGTVKGLGREDVAAFHAARFRPGGAALVLVGGVTLEEARALAEKAFGGWAGGAPAPIAIADASPARGGRIYLVDRQDAPQSVISVSLPAPPRAAPDFYALAAGDAVYGGGGFGTRLNLNLREDKGYSYGVFTNLAPLSRASAWAAAGGVQTDKTKESLVEFRKELADFAGARPVTAAELEEARLRKLRGYAQQFESFARVSGQVMVLWTQGLPFSELQKEADATAAVTLEQVRAAAARHARPGDAIVVVVGDRSKIEGPLASLGLELVPLDAEGRPAGDPISARPIAAPGSSGTQPAAPPAAAGK